MPSQTEIKEAAASFDRQVNRAAIMAAIIKNAEALIHSADTTAFRDSVGLQITALPAFDDLKSAIRRWRHGLV